VLGSEVGGLSPSILKECDKILEIPMRGVLERHKNHPKKNRKGKESLNVAVAFAIVAFHIRHQ